MGEIDLRELQQTEFKILIEVDRICRKLNVKYFLFYGTLLGAVRHKGFIPWDDDIDVVMLRDDYERFKREAGSELPEYYFLQTLEGDKGYPSVHTKVRDSRTAFIEDYVADRKMNHGMFIDIFPMDGVPNSPLVRGVGWKALSVLGRLALLKSVPSKEETLIMKLSKCFIGLVPLSGRNLTIIYSRLCALTDVGKADHVASSAWPTDPLERIIYPKDWFDDVVMLEFEGKKFPAPVKYDLVLTQLYGDYMSLPPEEKRVVLHTATMLSTTVPYTEFQRSDR